MYDSVTVPVVRYGYVEHTFVCILKYVCHSCLSAVSGEDANLQPPADVNVTFEEKAEDPTQPGLFTVNVSWTHPIGMCMHVHICVYLFNMMNYLRYG